MISFPLFRLWRRKHERPFSPEDIFLDTRNLPGFDTERFEGRLEQPVRKSTFISLGVAFSVIGAVLLGRAIYLAGINGDVFTVRADGNHLQHVSVVPPRGVIYDRNLKPLAFNVAGFRVFVAISPDGEPLGKPAIVVLAEILGRDESELSALLLIQKPGSELAIDVIYDWEMANKLRTVFKDDTRVRIEEAAIRAYDPSPAIAHVVGYMGKVNKNDVKEAGDPFVWPMHGRSGIELMYEPTLRGELGKKIVETDSYGHLLGENMFEREQIGGSLVLSISAELQERMYGTIKETVEERGFTGGSAVMINIQSGEVLGLVSYPGFDLNVMSRGKPREKVMRTLDHPQHPLFNRVVSGEYPPGSTVKPFIASAAVEENIIDPGQPIFTTGKIVVPNPYNPSLPTIFPDWRDHGWVNMFRAIAVSSNAYFYTIGGGANGIVGLGLDRLRLYFATYGFGSPTGVDLQGEESGLIPDAVWKATRDPGDPDWRIGDTYHLSIGQGGILVTPLQVARALVALAKDGFLIKPRLLRGFLAEDGKLLGEKNRETIAHVSVSPRARAIAQEGMLLAVKEGTAQGVDNLPISVGGKTGTAQFGPKDKVHSWFMGFAPYENPEVVLVVNLESGPASNLVGATYVASKILYWYSVNEDVVYKQGF